MTLLHAVLLKSVANEFGENSAYKFSACISHIRSSLVLVLKKLRELSILNLCFGFLSYIGY